MAKKIGVILSGCGVYDGSELNETVITLLAIDRAGAEAVCMAPNIEQMHVINHLSGEPTEGETRNVLVESARIARGNIKDTATVTAADFDALILPGGFGAAKNLCDFAVKGPDCNVNPDVSRLVKETVVAKKPLAAICIAPALLAKGTAVHLAASARRHPASPGSASADPDRADPRSTPRRSCPRDRPRD